MNETFNAISDIAEDYKTNGFRVTAEIKPSEYYKLAAFAVGTALLIAVSYFMIKSLFTAN